jgi:membrane-associated phospholipid phosphatase
MWMVPGIAVAWAVSSAGPCYYQVVVGKEDPSAAALLAQLDTYGGTFARVNQVVLWNASQVDQWFAFGGISAFPSLHVGLAVLMAIILWHRSRPLGCTCWAYAVVMQIGSVVLAWHYAVDGYAGALLAWGCWRVAGRLTRSAPGILRNQNGL